MKGNKAFIITLLCSVVMAIVLTIFNPVVQLFDSTSYFDAWASLGQGHLDMLRTPVYPFILHLMQILFKAESLLATVFLQYLVFFLSVWYFYRLAIFFCSKSASFWIALIYAASPAICVWNNHIMTESFAISGFVILLYLAHRLLQSPSAGKAVLFTAQSLFLLLLRPGFVYILPVFAAFALLLFFQKKRRAATLFMAGVLVASFCLLGYMGAFKKEYGVFAPSSVSIINQYSIARNFGYLNPEDAPDSLLKKELIAIFEDHGDRVDNASIATHEAFGLCQRHQLTDLQSTVTAGKRKAPVKVLKGLLVRLYSSCMGPVFASWIPSIGRLSRAFSPSIGLLYLFLFVYIILFGVQVIRTRELPPYCTLFLMLGVSCIIVSVVGAQNDWGRLIAPSIPIWLLLVGQVGRLFPNKETSILV